MPHNQEEELWEKEFETKFAHQQLGLADDGAKMLKLGQTYLGKELKSFIRTLLASQKAQLEGSYHYAHMCRDDHEQIGHNDSEYEMCPLCRAIAAKAQLLEEVLKEIPDNYYTAPLLKQYLRDKFSQD